VADVMIHLGLAMIVAGFFFQKEKGTDQPEVMTRSDKNTPDLIPPD